MPSSRTRPITSTPNGTSRSFASSRVAQVAELVDDVGDRPLALAAEEEAGVEDDQLGAGGLRETGRVVEHAERHLELLLALDMAHERGERRVHRERDVGGAQGLAERRGASS